MSTRYLDSHLVAVESVESDSLKCCPVDGMTP